MRSVRHKLFAGVLITSLAALLVTGVSMAIYDLHSYRLTWVNDLSTQAELIGRASVPALQFDDANLAHTNLSLLRVRPMIDAAALYNAKGALFARYIRDGIDRGVFPVLAEADGIRFDGENVVLNRRIVENNEIVGSIYLRAHYEFSQRLWNYVGILLAVSSLALVISLLLSSWLQANVTRPILAVTSLAREVVERRDYSLRATKTTEDEIGYMVDAFNGMLTEIARRTEAMEASNRNLEREMAERTGAEQALRDSEKRYRTLVATLTSVVWIANRSGEFVVEQPSWAAYTGQTEEQYRNAGWRRAFHTENRQLVERLWSQAENSKRALDCEAPLWHASSARYRIISLRALPVLDAEGKIQEWVGTVTDIDDRRRAEDEIRRLNAELEGRVQERTAQLQEANRELEAFSFSVSHDLRAPLRAVDGFAKIREEDYGQRLDDEGRRLLGVVRDSSQRMGQLIDDLLEFSRLGRQVPAKRRIDMTSLAREVADELVGGSRAEVALAALPAAEADRALLKQVWVNLIGNALKYSGKREAPRIEIGAREEQSESVYWVRDNGAGFDMRYAAKLFGVFQRLHGQDEFPGTGVGLAIVQRVVTRHGGRVWAEGRPDEGACFFFSLPKKT
jgi:PAS domain S-box-containing protein